MSDNRKDSNEAGVVVAVVVLLPLLIALPLVLLLSGDTGSSSDRENHIYNKRIDIGIPSHRNVAFLNTIA